MDDAEWDGGISSIYAEVLRTHYARVVANMSSRSSAREFARFVRLVSSVCVPGVYERSDSTPECPKFSCLLGIVPSVTPGRGDPLSFIVLDMDEIPLGEPRRLPAFADEGFLSFTVGDEGMPVWRYRLVRAFDAGESCSL